MRVLAGRADLRTRCISNVCQVRHGDGAPESFRITELSSTRTRLARSSSHNGLNRSSAPRSRRWTRRKSDDNETYALGVNARRCPERRFNDICRSLPKNVDTTSRPATCSITCRLSNVCARTMQPGVVLCSNRPKQKAAFILAASV
jgi:hypothetical protein